MRLQVSSLSVVVVVVATFAFAAASIDFAWPFWLPLPSASVPSHVVVRDSSRPHHSLRRNHRNNRPRRGYGCCDAET